MDDSSYQMTAKWNERGSSQWLIGVGGGLGLLHSKIERFRSACKNLRGNPGEL